MRGGGPSAPSDPKVAIAASAKPLAGKKFKVLNAKNKVVLRGKLKKVKGNPDPWRHAASADWSKVATPGSYRIKAGGATSRPWLIASGRPIEELLRIYAVNSDGNEPNPVFGPSHLNDATLKGGGKIDLVGGWRDAGDMLKFTQTIAESVSYLHIAARLAPEHADQLKATAAVGVRWLKKAHPSQNVFVALVGDDRDHSTGFRDPAGDDANTEEGVGKRIAYPSISSTVLGEAAAALALAGEVDAAKQWYERAVLTNSEVDIDDPNVPDFYPEDFFHDDLAFAADALWRATGEQKYLDDAGKWLSFGSENELYSGIVVGNPRPLVAADLCGGLGLPAAGTEPIRELACEDVRKTMDAIRSRIAERAFGSPGIYTFGWVQDNNAAGVLAAAAERAGVADDGFEIAAAARDYLRGRNQWGRSFVVGTKPFQAHNPHHSAFLKGNPSELMAGAVVGGAVKSSDVTDAGLPAAKGKFNGAGLVYEDKRENYVTSEVGLAYSAPAVLLAASLGG